MAFRNEMKKKLKDGKVVFGSWITISHPEVPEILSQSGFDWFLFDMEHGPITVAQLENLLQTTKPDVTPVVRVPEVALMYAKQALDVGGHGIMFPMVSTVKQAQFAVSCCKYPPDGIRGTGARRASVYYTVHDDYLKQANAETLVLVQIETAEAVNNFQDIINVKGIDGWFVGPNDLAASLGHIGEPNHPKVMEAMEKMANMSEKYDVPGGTLSFSQVSIRKFLEMGLKIMAVGSDDFFLLNSSSVLLKELRDNI